MNAILEVLRAIPRGRVAAYGQVAALAGSPRSARQVARVLHSLARKEDLPWHRVLNRNGDISLPGEGGALQAHLLRKEDVEVGPRGKVDLGRFGWEPARSVRPRSRRSPRPSRARPAGGAARRSP